MWMLVSFIVVDSSNKLINVIKSLQMKGSKENRGLTEDYERLRFMSSAR